MRIRWTPAAVADLQHISDYLKDHHPHYRQPTMRKVYAAIQSLKEWPRRTRGRNPRACVPSPALCRRLSREGAEHRSLADLSRCSGPALMGAAKVERQAAAQPIPKVDYQRVAVVMELSA